MLVIYPFSLVDQDQALKNARWIAELDKYKSHDVFILTDHRCDPEIVEGVVKTLTDVFRLAKHRITMSEVDGWPEGANHMFGYATCLIQHTREWPYFLWLEPDAIPLVPGWLNALEAEYRRGKKLFMGDRVQVGDIPLHMSGVAIYPNPIYMHAGEAYRAHDEAWDMASRFQVIPQAHWTLLIEHAWRHPTFKDQFEVNTQIAKETVLFHSSKDGSLIDRLREKQYGNQNLPPLQDRTTDRAFPDATLQRASEMARMHSLREQEQSRIQTTHEAIPQTSHGSTSGSSTGGGMGNQIRQDKEANPLQTMREGDSTPRTSSGHQQETGSDVVVPRVPLERAPVYDIFIRTYPGDYEWLDYSLQSIQKFVTGFRKIWIISPQPAPAWNWGPNFAIEWKVINDETGDGYLAQQITKLYADAITDYQPDYILHVDSDVIFTRPTTPGDFFTLPVGTLDVTQQQLIWYYTPYEAIQTPWQPITSRFMAFQQPYEFMRRFPMMMPRWLYARLREFCHNIHGVVISDYIRTQPLREFSEFNALGAYAFFHHRDQFSWVDTTTIPVMPLPFAKQFFSWGKITPEIKSEIETILSGAGEADVIAPAPSRIKILPNNVWVIDGDQIGNWIEQSGNRLDHDPNLLPVLLGHINPGDIVIDAGAYIGDHTIAYACKAGTVHAFEPHPLAYKCLYHNMEGHGNVTLHDVALGDKHGSVPLSGNNGEIDGCYIGTHMKVCDVPMQPLDDYLLKPDFIKIDVEGYELKVLQGAEKTIEKHQPRMAIEINSLALERQDITPDHIFGWLTQHGYEWRIIEDNALRTDPLYNILCFPKQPPEQTQQDAPTLIASSPVAPLPEHAEISTRDRVRNIIAMLKEISEQSPLDKSIVMQHLVISGLRKSHKATKAANRKRKQAAKKLPF